MPEVRDALSHLLIELRTALILSAAEGSGFWAVEVEVYKLIRELDESDEVVAQKLREVADLIAEHNRRIIAEERR